MRLWSLHPRYLDRQGLTAAWREALLAQAVLSGRTRGYTEHPQLERFRQHAAPRAVIGAFLGGIHLEATARGYSFDATRIEQPDPEDSLSGTVPVTNGQMEFEWAHLMAKLESRTPDLAVRWRNLPVASIRPHPVCRRVPGGVESWERGRPEARP